jgi:hypothetical protein
MLRGTGVCSPDHRLGVAGFLADPPLNRPVDRPDGVPALSIRFAIQSRHPVGA